MVITSRVLARLVSVIAVVVATVGLAPAATAAHSPTPIGPTGWRPDGPVHAVVASGSHVYVGGAFTGGVVALDATSGALEWTANTNGTVRALALSSTGSHLIAGGAFTAVDGVTHRKLVSLHAGDGRAVSAWKAAAGGLVRDIVVVGDTAYFGGGFAKHSGIEQRGLGAVSVSTGKRVATFTPSTDNTVMGLATDGTRLFVAGNFTSVNGVPRESLASVTLAGASLDSWRPARACTRCNVYWDITVDQGTVYTASRNAGAVRAVDASTGAQRWRVTANGDAQAITVADGLVYAGGHFTTISGQDRTILAALQPANGALTDYSVRFVTTWPGIWALAGTDERLYVGGHFTAAGPKPNRYPYFAMFGPG